MKGLLVLFFSVFFVFMGGGGIVNAEYCVDDTQTFPGDLNGYVDRYSEDRVIEWWHPLGESGCSGCNELKLTITADDVDAGGWIGDYEIPAEIFYVTVFQDLGDSEKKYEFSEPLASYGGFTPFSEIQEGPGGNLSITELVVNCSDLAFDIDFALDLGVRIEVGAGLDLEIERSQLQISPVPAPSALFLLGTGVLGVVGLRRKLK